MQRKVLIALAGCGGEGWEKGKIYTRAEKEGVYGQGHMPRRREAKEK